MLTALIGLIALGPQTDHSTDRHELTQGVTALVAAGGALPGVLSVSGKAFVIVTSAQSKGRVPIFAATRVEKGRAVAGSHEAFFSPASLANPSNGRFFADVLDRKST